MPPSPHRWSYWRCFDIYQEDDLLTISGLQHFAFCKRQWALINIEGLWRENLLTAQGKLLHERVHDEEQTTFTNGMLVVRSLPLHSLRLGIYGVADVVEFKPDSQGIPIAGYPGKYLPYPVEYKRGSTKSNDCDRIQMCAQALCLEEMLSLNLGEGSLFYGETRRRERVTLDSGLRGTTEAICAEMRKIYETKVTPLPNYSAQCKSCSLENECKPKAVRRSAKQYWKITMDTMEDGQ